MENTDLIRIKELLRFTQTQQLHTEALARATGEHFNVFDILGIGHYEVKTHSPMLGELLNPKGRHGQGCMFLELFLGLFVESNNKNASFDQKISEFYAESASLKEEFYIGPVNVNYTEGGKIDIVLTDKNGNRIFIENKIEHGDEPKQMFRYHAYDKSAVLFYLTLNGRPPSANSMGGGGFEVHCVSYEKDILRWLKLCRKEAACLPSVREIISQYIHLIEKLTNQSTTITMNKELITELTKDKESLAIH